MGIQSKEGYQSVRDWTASYRPFMDDARAQRHLANVERHIAEGRASVLRQQEIIGRLESAGSGRSETASIARAFLHQMEQRLEMHIANRDRLQDQLLVRSDGQGLTRLWGTLFN
jgi:hypothetical protein